MTDQTLILSRLERCKSQYPKDKADLAHKALMGDSEADWLWTQAVAKRRTLRSKIRAAWNAVRRG